VKDRTFGAFDYLIVVFLNIRYFYARASQEGGRQLPEFFTLPRAFIKQHHYRPASGFQKVRTRGLDLSPFKDDLGFEQIARDLDIPYPTRTAGVPIGHRTDPRGQVAASPQETPDGLRP
jgi:hypothetical protein